MAEAQAVKEHTDITTREVEAPENVTGMAAMIERLAKSPDVDVSKLEKLLDMQERILDREAKAAFDEAMSECQAEMLPISQDAANPQTRSKYASYLALDKAMKPIYTNHGFSVEFDTDDSPKDQYVRVICEVSRGGFTKRKHFDVPADGKGAKGGDVMTKTHAALSAVSYGRRALLKMAFNIAEGEHDDDGNAAGAGEKVSEDQLNELLALADDVKADKEAFCKYFGIESFADIPANAFDRAKAALEKKREKADA